MTILYSELATAYHEMYQSIFDYRKEFQSYDRILKKYQCRKILEIGCGSGNLAPFFLKAGYDYIGLDLFNEMIAIAEDIEPKAKFVQGDMRDLRLKDRFDAILITGRSFTYMTTNDDVMKALKSIHKHLKKDGLLIFDNFDAEKIFGDFKGNFVHTAKYKGKEYKRVSRSSLNMQTGWTWDWNAAYHIKEKGKTKVIQDHSVLRAFTVDELRLFLKMNRFDALKLAKKDASIIAVAKKL